MLVASRQGIEERGLWLRYWKPFLLLLVLAALYAPVIAGLVRQWYTDPDYSHGFLVPVFSGYLIHKRRSVLNAIPLSPSLWGLPILLFSLALLFLGSLGAELFLSRIAL